MQKNSINSALQTCNWPVQKVLAFTTTRNHPFKKNVPFSSPFQSFNLGTHVGDDLDSVLNNRQLLKRLLPEKMQIQWLEQVHGAEVVTLTNYNSSPLIADAIVTKKHDIALAIMTADCLPILLSAKDGSEIAAIHGGWRPLFANIIANTLNKMTTANHDICAWLGPCIGDTAFEVGNEVRENFISLSETFQQAFIPVINPADYEQKYLANLSLIAQLQLRSLGINNIECLPHCTFNMEQDYYSYRRDGKTGRMVTIIARS